MWVLAQQAASDGDVLRTTLAVRDALHTGPPPDALPQHVGPAFTDAWLTATSDLPAWRVLAQAWAAAHLETTSLDDAQLAWELMRRVVEAAPPEAQPEHIVTLATLQVRAGHAEAAQRLARGAQQAARIHTQPDVFAAASWLLADVADQQGDPQLARDEIRHALRWMQDMGDPGAATRFAGAVRDHRPHWTQA